MNPFVAELISSAPLGVIVPIPIWANASEGLNRVIMETNENMMLFIIKGF
jgi:hypothetical protein